MTSEIGKRELARMVKLNAAALLEISDLDELLGDEVHNAICNNEDLLECVEKRRNALVERIRRM